MAVEIVDFPIKNGGSFHCKLLVHQRVIIPTDLHIFVVLGVEHFFPIQLGIVIIPTDEVIFFRGVG